MPSWEIVLTVAEIKGWAIETTWVEDLIVEHWGTVRRLKRNWQEFQKGNHVDPLQVVARQTP